MTRSIVVFGPQGSGKGTQAEMLSKKIGAVYVSTGNIFRWEAKHQTPLGKQVEKYLGAGQLVPDDITITTILRHLNQPTAHSSGFVLDGFPRNQAQLAVLEGAIKITDAVIIDLPDKEAIARISHRSVCVCGRTYHKDYQPPKKRGICDACGRKLFVRADDKPAAIKRRLKTYHQETEPLFKALEQQGILHRINGAQSIPEVHQALLRVLKLA